MSEQGQQRAGRDNRDRNAGDVAADPKGALTLNQANIFDGLMKTAVRTRVTGRSKMRRWLIHFATPKSFVKSLFDASSVDHAEKSWKAYKLSIIRDKSFFYKLIIKI